MIPSLNAIKRASAYLRADIRTLEINYRMLDRLGLQRESVERSNAMCDLMQVDQMLTEKIELLESKPKKRKTKKT